MKQPKIDTSGSEAAQKAIADAQTAANNLKQNYSADLSNDNLTNVVAGGGAEAGGITASKTRKRPGMGGLSSSLGIN